MEARTTSPPGKDERVHDADEDGFLGEYWPTTTVRLTLHREGTGAVLLRHRNPRNSDPNPGRAAEVTCVDGAVTRIEWDGQHHKWNMEQKLSQPVWMPMVEDWIRATIEAAS